MRHDVVAAKWMCPQILAIFKFPIVGAAEAMLRTSVPKVTIAKAQAF